MLRIAIVSIASALMASTASAEPIALRDMGSFHVGGRLVEVSGKPVKEVVFTAGGVPAKIDPNGTYQVEQMYVPYFLPVNERGAYPLLMWHGGGLTGVIDRVGLCIILFHSQAGSFGFKVAQPRPDKVKALIAIEPAAVGDPAKVERLKNIPTLMVYGDNIERDSCWPKIRATGIAFADGINAAGGSVDVVDLPQAGIEGNSHMMMMDKNNTEVAALIQKWLEGKGLTK